MHCTLLFIISLLNTRSSKTESVDYVRKNSRMDILPFLEEKEKDMELFSPRVEDTNEQEWNDIEFKYQPNNYRNIINLDDNQEHRNEEIDYAEDQFKSIDQLDGVQLAQFSKYLTNLLQHPKLWEAPLVLIKDSQDNLEDRTLPLELDGLQNFAKKSRYYRRYPWKRQNTRSYKSKEYDPYNACNPTRNDVFQLLVAVHDARQGNKSRFVNFCNRRRPASSVFTNIRFLGR